MEKESKVITIEDSAIQRFCAGWPCHNFPEGLNLIVAFFDKNGDLVDYEMSNKSDKTLYEFNAYEENPTHNMDEAAISALLSNAQEECRRLELPDGCLPTWVYD